MNKIIDSKRLPLYWSIGIVLVYSLLMSQYFITLNQKIFLNQVQVTNNSILSYLTTINFFMIIGLSFVVWTISSLMFHVFAMLFDGRYSYKKFIKLTGLCYIFPLIGYLMAIILIEKIEFPKNNISFFIESNRLISLINWIINISSGFAFAFIIPIIKYQYQINWLKSIGSILIPLGSIYVLGQFFANYVL